jgi:hypothetical protein
MSSLATQIENRSAQTKQKPECIFRSPEKHPGFFTFVQQKIITATVPFPAPAFSWLPPP